MQSNNLANNLHIHTQDKQEERLYIEQAMAKYTGKVYEAKMGECGIKQALPMIAIDPEFDEPKGGS